MEKTVKTLVEFDREATRFARTISPSPRGATLVTLSGELGVGKTTFIKAVAKAFDIKEVVTSPTFVLEKIYTLSPKAECQTFSFGRLIHIDAYRLSPEDTLTSIGFGGVMKDNTNLVLFEWPEKVSKALPKATINISIKVLNDGSRTIAYD